MKIPVIDLHADTFMKHLVMKTQPYLKDFYQKNKKTSEYKKVSENFSINPKNLFKGNVKVQTQSLFLDNLYTTNGLHFSMKTISLILQHINENENLFRIRKISDIRKNLENDKTGIFISIEGLEVIQNDLDLLDIFYDLGVRIVAPTWNRIVPYASSIMEESGIFEKGKELAQKMNEMQMILDVSHLSVKSFFDFEKITSCPFIASHSNIQSINSHQRNLNNDQLKVIQERKGVFGINFCPSFINPATKNISDNYPEGYEWIYRQIEYAAENFTLDIVAFGSDFDGISSTPTGIESPEFYPLFADFLIEKGVSREDIEKIFYKNALRVFEQLK